MTRAKSKRWWVESITALAVMSAFVFWQGKDWTDLSEFKAAVMFAMLEGVRSLRRELGGE